MKILFRFAILISACVLLVGCTTKNNNSSAFSEEKAIATVIKDHPDFPSNTAEVGTKKLSTGGMQDTYANVKFTTSVEKVGENVYDITLTKDWGIRVNGKYAKSFWKYKVDAGSIKLINSVDNEYLPMVMK